MSDYKFPAPSQNEVNEACRIAYNFGDASYMGILAGAYQESQQQLMLERDIRADLKAAIVDLRKKLDLGKHVSPYRIERPEGIPEWVGIGVVCEYSDDNMAWVRAEPLSGYFEKGDYPYRTRLSHYRYARPVLTEPKWKPKDNEPVAYWWENEKEYRIASWGYLKAQMYSQDWSFAHWSGQHDMRVEALEDEPRYKV